MSLFVLNFFQIFAENFLIHAICTSIAKTIVEKKKSLNLKEMFSKQKPPSNP
jgi:hypothetical protein